MRRIILVIVVVAIATLAWAGISALQADNTPPGVSSSSSVSVEPSAATSPSASSRAPAFAFYYLWWSIKHWHDKLGPDYQFGAEPLPLPASLPPDGCPPNNLYAGNQLTDVPAHLWSQDDPGQTQADEREAASAGLTGFAVNWVGGPTYDARLADAFRAADKLRDTGVPFSLMLSYKSSATVLPLSTILADLAYYRDTYASDASLYRINGLPVVILQGSRKYDDATLAAIDAEFGDTFRIIGDESPSSYTPERGAYMYGVSYYWSTQDPYENPESFGQLEQFASAVRATAPNADGTRKMWWAPFTPGYDGVLLGGSTCIPRRNGDTMRALFDGNAASHPDAWTLISWNEIAEGTYVDPLQRYGRRYLDVLRHILGQGR
ncbi:MAG TPA: hypothetical protein VJ736_01700 [Actinomycetota bacterium]|nr:hypothetical protein [Actinomycetota bacterium]